MARGGLRALRRVRVPVKGGVTSPAGLLSPEARGARCLGQRPRRARLLHAGGASLIHVQLLRLPTLQYSSPRAGQPFTTLKHKTTLLSSLNVSGFTTLNNTTNINASLNVSGINILQTLNNYSTDLSVLSNSNTNIYQTLNNYSTDLSILFNND